MSRILLIALTFCAAAAAGAATVYKHVMPDGSVRYSDQPREPGAVEATPIDLPEPQTYAPPPSEARPFAFREPEAGPAPAAPPPVRYEAFAIVAPADGAGLRVNSGDVPVELSLTPPLADGHVFEVYVDGVPAGMGRESTIVLPNVSRGRRTLRAAVKGADGAELAATEPVEFDLLRTSRCDRNRLVAADCAPLGPCDCGPLRPGPF